MFEWKVEDMVLMNNNHMDVGVKIYDCEAEVSREDKIAFVDSMTDGKLSYILDNWYHYGIFNFLGCERNIQLNCKGTYDTYEDMADEVFHRQLLKCEEQERKYFLEHDEYSILKTRLREYTDKYSTSFGVNMLFSSDGKISVYDGKDYETRRDITMEELKVLLSKYEQIDALVKTLTEETHIGC